jgi:hypothetical protein
VPSHQHADFNPLLDALLRFAKECLLKDGAFLPFAAEMSRDGEISHLAGYTGEERPGAPKVLASLEAALRAQAKQSEMRAAGIAVDIRFASRPNEPKSDAIQVFLEHREGNVVNVILPYWKMGPGDVRYGRLMAVRGEAKIFPDTRLAPNY